MKYNCNCIYYLIRTTELINQFKYYSGIPK